MRLPYFEYLEPTTVGTVLEALSGSDGQSRLLAGGTDLLPLLKLGLAHPRYMISLRNIADLKGVRVQNGELHIGSMTTLTALLPERQIQGAFTCLHEAVEAVAAPPIQNVATVGGNLCQNSRCLFYNQSETWRRERRACLKAGGDVCLAVPGGGKCFSVYQGDLAPAIMAFEGKVKIGRQGSHRVVPLQDIFSGRAEEPIGLGSDELITGITLPLPSGRVGSAYRKLRLRSSMDYPLLSAAAVITVDNKERIDAVRLVLGACGPAPVLLGEAGASLLGKKPADVDPGTVVVAVPKGLPMVENLFLPASYRRKMAPVFARRALQAAVTSLAGKEMS